MAIDLPQTFPDQSSDIFTLLIIIRVTQGLILAKHFMDFARSFILDIGATRQKTETPSHEGGECIKTSRKHGQADGGELVVVQLRLFVEDDICLDAGLVGSLLHTVIQVAIESSEVFIAAVSHFLGLLRVRVEGVQAQQRDIVLEIARGASELADLFFDVGDFIEQILFLRGHTHTPVEGQSQTETETLDHGHGVDSNLAGFSILVQFRDESLCLNVQVGDIALDGRTVERGGGALSAALQ